MEPNLGPYGGFENGFHSLNANSLSFSPTRGRRPFQNSPRSRSRRRSIPGRFGNEQELTRLPYQVPQGMFYGGSPVGRPNSHSPYRNHIFHSPQPQVLPGSPYEIFPQPVVGFSGGVTSGIGIPCEPSPHFMIPMPYKAPTHNSQEDLNLICPNRTSSDYSPNKPGQRPQLSDVNDDNKPKNHLNDKFSVNSDLKEHLETINHDHCYTKMYSVDTLPDPGHATSASTVLANLYQETVFALKDDVQVQSENKQESTHTQNPRKNSTKEENHQTTFGHNSSEEIGSSMIAQLLLSSDDNPSNGMQNSNSTRRVPIAEEATSSTGASVQQNNFFSQGTAPVQGLDYRNTSEPSYTDQTAYCSGRSLLIQNQTNFVPNISYPDFQTVPYVNSAHHPTFPGAIRLGPNFPRMQRHRSFNPLSVHQGHPRRQKMFNNARQCLYSLTYKERPYHRSRSKRCLYFPNSQESIGFGNGFNEHMQPITISYNAPQMYTPYMIHCEGTQSVVPNAQQLQFGLNQTFQMARFQPVSASEDEEDPHHGMKYTQINNLSSDQSTISADLSEDFNDSNFTETSWQISDNVNNDIKLDNMDSQAVNESYSSAEIPEHPLKLKIKIPKPVKNKNGKTSCKSGPKSDKKKTKSSANGKCRRKMKDSEGKDELESTDLPNTPKSNQTYIESSQANSTEQESLHGLETLTSADFEFIRELLVQHWEEYLNLPIEALQFYETQNAHENDLNDATVRMVSDPSLHVWQLVENITKLMK